MIYFDNAATTKPLSTAILSSNELNDKLYFNPSALYREGISAKAVIKDCKEKILSFLKTEDHEVVFTSCGSESDNQAVFCAKKRGIFVTDLGEHSAIYQSFSELKNRGLSVHFVELNQDGSVNTDNLYDFIKNNPDVSFVSIVHVNNETGAINDINSIAKNIKAINKNIVFHSDGVQAFGKIPFRLDKNIDLYSISAHKINGLKGTGALIKRKGLNLFPLIFGGGQENGLRSGTENVFGINVFRLAAENRYKNLRESLDKITEIRNYIKDNIDKSIFDIISGETSSPYIFTVSAKGVRGETIMHLLEEKNIIVGNGSACSSKQKHSRVIKACGYSENVLDGVIRISFSPENTIEEAIIFTKELNETVKTLKGIIGK